MFVLLRVKLVLDMLRVFVLCRNWALSAQRSPALMGRAKETKD